MLNIIVHNEYILTADAIAKKQNKRDNNKVKNVKIDDIAPKKRGYTHNVNKYIIATSIAIFCAYCLLYFSHPYRTAPNIKPHIAKDSAHIRKAQPKGNASLGKI
ncbi:MAG: hypothetical protein IJW54_03095 [Clostridia bacterium]|nr:hypothetical protein [Clostridia bacterium]